MTSTHQLSALKSVTRRAASFVRRRIKGLIGGVPPATSSLNHKHVIFFGADLVLGDPGAAGWLAALRFGLDRLPETTRFVNVWIERCRGVRQEEGNATGLRESWDDLSPDQYVRIMRGGTRSIEVVRPIDAMAVRRALDAHERHDVVLFFRWLGCANQTTEADLDVLVRAVAQTDKWLIPNSHALATLKKRVDPNLFRDKALLSLRYQVLPDHRSTDPLRIAASYQRALSEVLASLDFCEPSD